MITCQQISELHERSKLHRLSLGNRLIIRLHGSICKNCRTYFKDSDLMDAMLRKRFRHLGNYQFSDQEKEALKEKLKTNR